MVADMHRPIAVAREFVRAVWRVKYWQNRFLQDAPESAQCAENQHAGVPERTDSVDEMPAMLRRYIIFDLMPAGERVRYDESNFMQIHEGLLRRYRPLLCYSESTNGTAGFVSTGAISMMFYYAREYYTIVRELPAEGCLNAMIDVIGHPDAFRCAKSRKRNLHTKRYYLLQVYHDGSSLVRCRFCPCCCGAVQRLAQYLPLPRE